MLWLYIFSGLRITQLQTELITVFTIFEILINYVPSGLNRDKGCVKKLKNCFSWHHLGVGCFTGERISVTKKLTACTTYLLPSLSILTFTAPISPLLLF